MTGVINMTGVTGMTELTAYGSLVHSDVSGDSNGSLTPEQFLYTVLGPRNNYLYTIFSYIIIMYYYFDYRTFYSISRLYCVTSIKAI